MEQALKVELVGLALGAAGFILLAVVIEEVESFEEEEDLTALDVVVAGWIAAHAPDQIVFAGVLLGNAGSWMVVTVLVAVAAAFSWRGGRRAEAVAIPLGAVLLQANVAALKWFFARPRPDAGAMAASGYSFPSGHAAFGAYLAVVLAWFVMSHAGKRTRAAPLLALAGAWAAFQAAGRMVVGVHYTSDVIAGVGLGLAVGGFGLALTPFSVRVLRTIRRRRARAAHT